MPRLKLLDVFCGAGGAAMGYYRASFTDIIGIDIEPQPRYPFDFVQMDFVDLFRRPDPCLAAVPGILRSSQ